MLHKEMVLSPQQYEWTKIFFIMCCVKINELSEDRKK